ncbi:MAG: 3-methyladenine glycosylase [Rhodoglobus sp.]|nr:3-methyladenine glycosylase [Rhodoglobus sp.]
MRRETVVEVKGPWSLTTSKAFWEGFAPQALPTRGEAEQIRTVFRSEADWLPVDAVVTQEGASARIAVSGDGDLDAAAVQVARFLALDIDASAWPEVGLRDPVIGDAQARLPGLRPCGFHSPYEAAAWAVLSQRIRIVQAAKLREELIREHGDGGAFPDPRVLVDLDLDLPGRKTEYLHAVAEAALEGRLDGAALRAIDPQEAIARVQEVKGLGPFAAELVVSAEPTHRMFCPAARAASPRRSRSNTARAAPRPRSRRPGGRSAPGRRCTCGPCARIAPTRSPATELRE